METFHFTYANFRYLVFQVNDQYYLLDRRPRSLIGYFFLPLNWFFHQKVYSISVDDYLKIQQKLNKRAKFAFPISIGSGLAVFIGSWSRIENISQYFETDFSIATNGILLFFAVTLAYLSIEIFYSVWRKSFISLFHLENCLYTYCQVRPVFPIRQYFKVLGARLFFLGLSLAVCLVYLYLGNWLGWIGSTIMLFLFFLSINVNFVPREEVLYKITHRIVNLEKNEYLDDIN